MSFTSAEPMKSRWSDVYISSSVQLFGATGAFLVMTTLILGLQNQHASGMQVATLIIAEMVPIVAFGRYVGRLVDRFDSRTILIVGGIGQVISCYALTQARDFAYVVAGGVCLSVFSAVVGTTRAALLPAMVTKDDLPKAAAIGQTASSLGMMLGPAMAGFLVGASNVRQTLTMAAFGFLATVLAGLLLRTRRGVHTDEKSERVAWRLSDDRLFQSVVWGMTLVVAAISAVNVAAVFFIIGTLGGSEAMYGIVESMWTTGVLVGAWISARLIRPKTTDAMVVRWMLSTLMLICVAIGLVGAVPAVLWMIPLYLLGGTGNGFQNVIFGTLMGRRTPNEARGQASATMQSHVNGGALLGFAAGGLALEVLDPRWIFVAGGALGVVATLAVIPFVLRVVAAEPGEVGWGRAI